MRTISKTRQIIDLAASRGSLLILGAVTVWLGASVGKEAYRKHQVQEEIARLKADVIALEAKKTNLASLIDSFNDTATIELEAKKRLNLKKPGEEVAVILRDKNDEAENIVQATGKTAKVSVSEELNQDTKSWLDNPLKWWTYITNQQ